MSKAVKGKLEERARLYNKDGQPIKIYTTKNGNTIPRIHRRIGSIVNTKELKDASLNNEIKYAGKVARYYSEIKAVDISKNIIKHIGKIYIFETWGKTHLIDFIRDMIKCKSDVSKEMFKKMTKPQLMDLAFKLASV